LLTEYLWPGNLDQLSELIRQAATEAKTSLLVPADLPKKFHDSLSAQRIGQPAETMVHLDSYLESVERELITRAIQQSKGNKTKAAKLLSINRAKLLRRLNYFQLEIEIGVEAEETDVIEPSAFEEIK
jgi:DNA-binding NtrC family response regulator